MSNLLKAIERSKSRNTHAPSEQLIADRQDIADEAKSYVQDVQQQIGLKGGMTPQQIETVKAATARIKEIDHMILKKQEAQALLDSIQSPGQGEKEMNATALAKDGTRTYLDRSPATLRSKGAEVREMIRTKALIGAGTRVIPTALGLDPVMLPGQTAYTLSQLLTRTVVATPTYQYLRQTQREHKAAVVAPGAEKPESKYSFDTVSGDLSIIAHLSEPFHEYWATDFPEAVDALTAELLNGIFDAEENLIINGSGTGGNPTGILNTSGVQTQAFVTDMLTTTRTAITKLETIGYHAGAFVLNPIDWQSIELARNSSGQLEYSSGPIDRAAMRLWGVPVATSTHVKPGTALALDLDAAHILTDAGVQIVGTNSHGDDFSHNQVRIRAEQRFAPAVTKPQGIVKMTLATE